MLTHHHAYVAYGDPNATREFAAYIARERGIDVAHNPDFHVRQYSSLDVDEARALRALASLSGAGLRVFVLGAHTIGREAQNALLKSIEEPGENTLFALLVPRGALLPTLRSRLLEIPFENKKKKETVAAAFLSALPSARSKLIGTIVEDKDKEAAYDLVCEIEKRLHERISDTTVRAALEELSSMRSYLMDRSASAKMILEHVALVVPTVK